MSLKKLFPNDLIDESLWPFGARAELFGVRPGLGGAGCAAALQAAFDSGSKVVTLTTPGVYLLRNRGSMTDGDGVTIYYSVLLRDDVTWLLGPGIRFKIEDGDSTAPTMFANDNPTGGNRNIRIIAPRGGVVLDANFPTNSYPGVADRTAVVYAINVDGFEVEGVIGANLNKYCFALAKTKNFRLQNMKGWDTGPAAGPIEIWGQCSDGYIADIEGRSHDDFISLQQNDTTTYGRKKGVGPIRNITIERIKGRKPAGGVASLISCYLHNSAEASFQDLRAVTGASFNATTNEATLTVANTEHIEVGTYIDVSGVVSGGPGNYNRSWARVTKMVTNTSVTYVLPTGAASAPGAYISGGSIAIHWDFYGIRMREIVMEFDQPGIGNAIRIDGVTPYGTVRDCLIDGVRVVERDGGSPAQSVFICNNVNVENFTLRDVTFAIRTQNKNFMQSVGLRTVERMNFEDIRVEAPWGADTPDSYWLNLDAATVGGTVTITNLSFIGGYSPSSPTAYAIACPDFDIVLTDSEFFLESDANTGYSAIRDNFRSLMVNNVVTRDIARFINGNSPGAARIQLDNVHFAGVGNAMNLGPRVAAISLANVSREAGARFGVGAGLVYLSPGAGAQPVVRVAGGCNIAGDIFNAAVDGGAGTFALIAAFGTIPAKAITANGAVTLKTWQSNVFDVNLTAAATLNLNPTPGTLVAGQTIMLRFTTTGAFAVTWGTNVQAPNLVAGAAGQKRTVVLHCDGAKWTIAGDSGAWA